MLSTQSQFEAAKQWRLMNLLLGLPASVLAAISGATALASTTGRFVAGVLALASAAFGGVLTTVNPNRRATQATTAANGYLEVQTRARQTRLIDLPVQPLSEARESLRELNTARDEWNTLAEPPDRLAYRRAKKNLLRGGQTYAADDASDQDVRHL